MIQQIPWLMHESMYQSRDLCVLKGESGLSAFPSHIDDLSGFRISLIFHKPFIPCHLCLPGIEVMRAPE